MSAGTDTEDESKDLEHFVERLYHKGERVYLYPLMNNEVMEEYRRTKKPYPQYIGKIQISKYPPIDSKWFPPKQALPPLSTSIGSRLFHKTVEKLEKLNEMGYDIYFTVNPLVYKKRVKETVKEIRYLVIESDKLSLEAQKVFMEMIKPNLRTAVYTGNKSIHMYLPLVKPIKNPHCIYPKNKAVIRTINNLLPDRPNIEIPAFDEVIAGCKKFLSSYNYLFDPQVLSNFAGLVRLPFFTHNKTGKKADVLFENIDPNIGYVSDLGSFGCELLDINKNCLDNCKIQGCASDGPRGMEGVCSVTSGPVESMVPSVNNCEDTRPVKEPLTTHIQKSARYLEDLRIYSELKKSGIPRRRLRRQLHKVMFTVARLFDWTEKKLLDEWEQILKINPNNIGLSVEDAIADLKNEWGKIGNKPFKFRLPVAKDLPEIDEERKKMLRERLKQVNCLTVKTVSNLIIEILYPAVRKAIVPCINGKVSLRAKTMWNACNGWKYRDALEWLDENNIMRLRNSSYVPGKRSRLYFVNPHLVLFLMGFEAKELTWSKAGEGGDIASGYPFKTPTIGSKLLNIGEGRKMIA